MFWAMLFLTFFVGWCCFSLPSPFSVGATLPRSFWVVLVVLLLLVVLPDVVTLNTIP